MPSTSVRQHSRTLKNGETVTVTRHNRSFEPGAGYDQAGRTPVQQLRRDRRRRNARLRRDQAAARAKTSAAKGWKQTKKRLRQSGLLILSGGSHIRHGFRLMTRTRNKKRAAAVCLMGAGMAEIGAAVAWQGIGLTITTVSILGATLGGALLIGRHGRHSQTAARKRTRDQQRATRRTDRQRQQKQAKARAADVERKKREALRRNRERLAQQRNTGVT